MKYKLKNNPIDTTSPTFLEDYFLGCGVNKLSSFLDKPDMFDEESGNTLRNIKTGVKMLMKHIEKKSSVFLQVD